jgi:predicted nucleic acid-binding protein
LDNDLVMNDESRDDLRERVEELLAKTHAKNSEAPTKYADQAGAFVESIIEAVFGEAFPIVPDANVLRGNIGHMCRNGRRPVLLTGANTRTFRLYCAEHVLDEVVEHAEQWASDLKIAHDIYIKCWERDFLPNLRLVRTTDLRRLLSPEERARIDALPDRDDVPSATLSLCLGAFYLTEDADARFAVYGEEADAEERKRWLDPLRCGGNAGELQKLMVIASAVPVLPIAGLWTFGRWLYDKSPWVLAIAAALGLFAASRVKREKYVDAGAILGEVLTYFVDGIVGPYYENSETFAQMAPAIPSWEALLRVNGRDSVLTRACLHTLARARKLPMRAGELAARLPALDIGQNAQRIGKMLRNSPCFFEPYVRLWQVGEAIVREPAADAP